MRAAGGQAAGGQAAGVSGAMRRIGNRLSRRGPRLILHLIADLLLGATLLLLLGAGVLAWRLGQGPMDVTWASRRLERIISQPDAQVRVRRATLAWSGYQDGVGGPFRIELDAISEVAPDGIVLAEAPHAGVSLPLWPLLLGRIEPAAIRVDAPSVTLARLADGSFQLTPLAATPARPPPPGRLLEELRQATRSHGQGALSRLRRVEVHDLSLLVHDAALGLDWRAAGGVDLRRLSGGGVLGRADLRATLGATSVALIAHADVLADGSGTALSLSVSPFSPATLLGDAAALRDGPAGMLAGLDAPVSSAMTARLGPQLELIEAQATLDVGAGSARLGDGTVPLSGGELVAVVTPTQLSLKRLELAFAPLQPGETGTRLTARGTLRQAAPGRGGAGQVTLDLDRAAFAELHRYWPGALGRGARAWITTNIVAGEAHDLHVELGLADAGTDLQDVTLTSLTAGFDADGVTGYWLRPLPPVTDARLRVDLDGADAVVVRLIEGRQDALSVAGSVIRINGLRQADQVADITAPIRGPLGGVLQLLANHRLNLLERAKLNLSQASGDFDGTLHVQLPLDARVKFDSIHIVADARVAQARFPAIVAGRDLDEAALSATISNDGLGITGNGRLGGLPSALSVALDFRTGPRTDVTTTVQLQATATPAQLAALGLDTGGRVIGVAGLQARYDERRDGRADLVLDADLARAALSLPLDVRKPAGGAASLHAHIVLDDGRLIGLDDLRADGPGLVLRSTAQVVDGAPRVLSLEQIVIGRTVGHGLLSIPATPRAAIRLSLAGSTLDLSALFAKSKPARQPPAAALRSASKPASKPPARGRAWEVDARFNQVLLAAQQPVSPFVVHAENDGLRLTTLTVDAGGVPVAITARLAGDGRAGSRGRVLALSAADAGVLLRSVDVADNIQGGRLSLRGRFDDSRLDAPLQAVAQVSGFRVTDAPTVARVLKAATLFGIADVLRGPGVSFSRLVLPFRYAAGTLDIGSARAVSPTLGITATGRLDLAADTADLRGTVVPAYLLNTALGRLPLVGKLFSPEKGGGVFAADFSIRGPFNDPVVSVNPLSVLAPGMLRRLFWGPEATAATVR